MGSESLSVKWDNHKTTFDNWYTKAHDCFKTSLSTRNYFRNAAILSLLTSNILIKYTDPA